MTFCLTPYNICHVCRQMFTLLYSKSVFFYDGTTYCKVYLNGGTCLLTSSVHTPTLWSGKLALRWSMLRKVSFQSSELIWFGILEIKINIMMKNIDIVQMYVSWMNNNFTNSVAKYFMWQNCVSGIHWRTTATPLPVWPLFYLGIHI